MAFDFDRSVTAAHFRATGWDLFDHNHSNPFECHHFYLCDFRTNHTQMFSVKQENVRNQSTPTFFSMEMLASGVGQLMLDMAKNKQAQELINECGAVVVCYAKNTQAYRQWLYQAQAGERLQMIINIYPNPTPDDKLAAMVRPFAVNSANPVLSADEVAEYSRKVESMDKTNHPEWFGVKRKKLGGRR